MRARRGFGRLSTTSPFIALPLSVVLLLVLAGEAAAYIERGRALIEI